MLNFENGRFFEKAKVQQKTKFLLRFPFTLFSVQINSRESYLEKKKMKTNPLSQPNRSLWQFQFLALLKIFAQTLRPLLAN